MYVADLVPALERLLSLTGFSALTLGNAVMIMAALAVMHVAFHREVEPLLLIPLCFGCLLANLPFTMMGSADEGGILYFFYEGIRHEIWPPLIFLGLGALMDFGPLLANPSAFLLGAVAQVGVFVTMVLASMSGFTLRESAAIGLIGMGDGPAAVFLSNKLSPDILGPVALTAYALAMLAPDIQQLIVNAITTDNERKIKMEPLKPVSQGARVAFPVVATVICALAVPSATPLIGMLMLGNLMRERGLTQRLSEFTETHLINTVTILLALSIGASMTAETFLRFDTVKIMALGMFSFVAATVFGVLMGKFLNLITGGKVNPLIGSAAISTPPVPARGIQQIGKEASPSNNLLLSAMGPNLAGLIGTSATAGILLAIMGPPFEYPRGGVEAAIQIATELLRSLLPV
ncbi:MAG: sodium ion-translocating decarboxylase subunit beta [Nitrospinae bacterium]|nr:sodium ion-translocating decarboxylase subunit beta [Nitrospinota bacterium]MBF0633526.1 sodium ion-translocating decarboxylase subunit beta [Nitrospinota bacterium]